MKSYLIAALMGFMCAISFGGGFALSQWRISPSTLIRLDNANNWECQTTLVYRPDQKGRNLDTRAKQ